jgi:formate hydrogenlyase subunit 3/multisubunit Na+/H+ antiporter MnhD subunit
VTTLLWVAPFAWPLVVAGLVVVFWRGGAPRLVPWLVATGPLPALLLAVAGPEGAAPALPWLLLDLRLGLETPARILLLATALVWLAAGIAARRLLAERWSTACLWSLTLAGNVGLILSADLVSLYSFYAIMTFSAYGLVVHDRTDATRRAGRVYVIMAVLGEAMLISGLVLAAGAAGSTDSSVVAAALAGADQRDLIVGLLTAGFAVKAGVVPLHVWLPLAHPAAPVPASAALSGAMIKAGLVGWLSVLPLGTVAATGWAVTLMLVGLVTAYAGALVGVIQDRAKVVLAYSSISQMGLITVLVGVAFMGPGAAPVAVAGAVTYALHHGVAKGALFLGVGVRSAWGGAQGRRLVLAGAAVAGLSLAGAPLTSGFVAKAAMKDAVATIGGPWAARLTTALTLAAVGTTLLIARVLILLARPNEADRHARRPAAAEDRAMVAGWALLLLATAVTTWIVPARWSTELPRPSVYASAVVTSTWPVVVGAGLAWAAVLAGRRRASDPAPPRIPAGDLVVLAERAAPSARRVAARVVATTTAARDLLGALVGRFEARVRPGEGFARLDVTLRRWQVAGGLFLLVGAALAAALGALG